MVVDHHRQLQATLLVTDHGRKQWSYVRTGSSAGCGSKSTNLLSPTIAQSVHYACTAFTAVLILNQAGATDHLKELCKQRRTCNRQGDGPEDGRAGQGRAGQGRAGQGRAEQGRKAGQGRVGGVEQHNGVTKLDLELV